MPEVYVPPMQHIFTHTNMHIHIHIHSTHIYIFNAHTNIIHTNKVDAHLRHLDIECTLSLYSHLVEELRDSAYALYWRQAE